MTGALDGMRVIELAGPFGNYAGKLFADLGADVVLVEPQEGSELRRRTPLTEEGESLWFTYHNANKRSVVATGKALDNLLAHADVFIGSGMASWPAHWGLDLDEVESRHPALVVASITPFGLDGPYSSFEATDIVCLAMGGLMSLGGYGDGAPLQVVGEQSFVAASLFAAVGTMIAVLHAESTGAGQRVDVSTQECVTMALEHAIQYYDLQSIVRGRLSGRQRGAGAGLYPCRDGYVYLFVGGIASNRFWDRFVEWLQREGADGIGLLTTPQWQERQFFDTSEAQETFSRVFEAFAATRGKEDLYAEGQALGIPIAPVRTPGEVVESEQLRFRDFFQSLTTPGGRDVLAPGAPYALADTPWEQRRRAPRLGEHTDELEHTHA